MSLILASSSPRRREILSLLGVPFAVIEPDFDEQIISQRAITEEVLDFALGKARSVASKHPENIVIGSDTMIFLDGMKIGKPRDRQDAARTLRLLAGKTHRIYTAVAIVDSRDQSGLMEVEEVSVDMRPYTTEDVEGYLAYGESLDKAGAYSIQGEGSKLIAAIRGDYLAAVGLPLRPIARYLAQRGMASPLDVDRLYRERSVLNWHRFS